MTGRRSAPLLTAARPVQDHARQLRQAGSSPAVDGQNYTPDDPPDLDRVLRCTRRVPVRDLTRVLRMGPAGQVPSRGVDMRRRISSAKPGTPALPSSMASACGLSGGLLVRAAPRSLSLQ